MRHSNRFLLAVLAALLLSACGTKGPLYQPSGLTTVLNSSSDDNSHVALVIRA